MTTYIRKQGKYIIGTDFGFGDDIAVEHVMTKDKDGKIMVVSSKIIGKAKDFDSEDKRNIYFKNRKEYYESNKI